MDNKLEEIINILGGKENKVIKDLLEILDDMELGEENKLEGLVFYAFQKNLISLDEIEKKYGSQVLSVINILLKLNNINYEQQDVEAENLRKMFFAITKDIRIIMLTIAFSVTELRNICDDRDRQISLAKLIFCLFAPISARLGLSGYKTELENGAFKLLEPETYEKIQTDVDNRFHKRQPIVERLKQLVEQCLKELNIDGKVYGRKKHIYSIYKKLKDHPLDKIYDLIAVRAIVKTIPECYALLGRLNSLLEPIKNRFKDYIATPKPNGYQSLHTTVKFEGFPVEIQIRTEDMHTYAEFGIASHVLYKEKRTNQDMLDIRLAWLRQMMEGDEVSLDELATSLSQDLYNTEILVQSPKGKIFYLPSGATPIDFAYSIHSEVGNKCVGARVNDKMVPVTSELHNGDVVEIITNQQSKGPSLDWLKICKTSEARQKINSFFKKNKREETAMLGKTMFENAIREKGYSVSKLTSKGMDGILKYYNLSEIDDLYVNIGTNAISAKYLANKLVQEYLKQIKEETIINQPSAPVAISTPSEKLVELKDLNNVLLKFANCCHPMYGDSIIGFVSAGRGVIIHRSQCPNVTYFRESRLIEAGWKPIENKETKKRNKS